MWGGLAVFSLDKMPEMVAFANKFHDIQTENTCFGYGFVGGMPHVEQPVVMTLMSYNGPSEEAEAFFKPVLDLQPLMNNCQMRPFKEMNTLMPNVAYESRRLMGGSNFTAPMDPEFMQEIMDEFLPFVQEHGIADGSGVLLELLGIDKIGGIRPDATAFAARGNFYQIAHTYRYMDEKLDSVVRAFNRKLTKLIKAKGTKGKVGQYNNYDSKSRHSAPLHSITVP